MFDRPVNVFPLPLLLYSSTPTIDAALNITQKLPHSCGCGQNHTLQCLSSPLGPAIKLRYILCKGNFSVMKQADG